MRSLEFLGAMMQVREPAAAEAEWPLSAGTAAGAAAPRASGTGGGAGGAGSGGGGKGGSELARMAAAARAARRSRLAASKSAADSKKRAARRVERGDITAAKRLAGVPGFRSPHRRGGSAGRGALPR